MGYATVVILIHNLGTGKKLRKEKRREKKRSYLARRKIFKFSREQHHQMISLFFNSGSRLH
jgi:hypothetical protein